MYKFKRQPRAKQLEAFERSKDLRHFALLMRMRTGKSKIVIDTSCYLFTLGRINALVIIAPNGVHAKWAKDDVPKDVPDYVDHKVAVWRSGNKKAVEEC